MTLAPLPLDSNGESLSGAPDWVVDEMPPGYHNRLAEIERLSQDLRAMDPFGRLLWGSGPQLTEAVRDAFLALKFEAALMPGNTETGIVVRLDAGRVLLHVAPSAEIIRKKSAQLTHAFTLLHESAEERDRVVLVANSEPATPPADRGEGIEPDALSLLRRISTNFMASATMFRLWRMSLHDQERARSYIVRLHAQEGGIFLPPAP
ncbi:MAG: hypothetical protein ABJA98_11305 [Acidobacteriota bacterium]